MCSLIFGLLITDKKDRVNRLIIICLFIHIAALIYTYSRSNTIAFLVSSLIMILSLKSISFRRKVIVLVASSTIFITGSIISYSLLSHDAQVSIMSSINSILTFSDQGDSTSISVRSKMILDGLILFFDSPVIGIGPGGFFSEVGIASHNTFIQIASEIGLLGLIFFILMIVLIIAISFKRESFALGALCCFVIIMFFQNLSDSMFFYTIAAFSMVSYQERRDEEIL
ncbi:O-antigen ligase family protein [Vibrio sp. 10N.261.55.F6]|uniref:O-antigen ligase family protein n=1 Tax=Vibrio sp. 10N.261.55.F6 TaxID=3229693 RepID=UPI00355258D8